MVNMKKISAHIICIILFIILGCKDKESKDYATNRSKPVIKIIGSDRLHLAIGEKYVEYGATATDATDGDISDKIQISSIQDTNTADNNQVKYNQIKYNVKNSAGQSAIEVTRSVTIFDVTPSSLIEFNHINTPEVKPGDKYEVKRSPNGLFLFDKIEGDRPIKIFDYDVRSVIQSAAFSPDWKYLAITNSGNIDIWELPACTLKMSIEAHNVEGKNGILNLIRYTPDGRLIISLGTDNKIKFWRAKDGELLLTADTQSSDFKFSSDGATVTDGPSVWSIDRIN